MIKTLLFLVSAGMASTTGQAGFTVRIQGATPLTAVTIAGKDYVPLADIADRLGAKLTDGLDDAGKREVLVTPGAGARKAFDDSPDTDIVLEGDTAQWQLVANGNGKMRVRDFYRRKDSWVYIGELDVMPGSVKAEGREPRDRMVLHFYALFKDGNGKTVGRAIVDVTGVSYDGGRYPIQINTENAAGFLPKSIQIRFNSAEEIDRRASG